MDTHLDSPNFSYLAVHDRLLVELGTLAERYAFEDPSTCLIKIRQFAELLAQRAAATVGAPTVGLDFLTILRALEDRRVLAPDAAQVFHELRIAGNKAAHQVRGSRSDALHAVKYAWSLGVWFHRSFGKDPKFSPKAFVSPKDPNEDRRKVEAEVERLTRELEAARRAGEAARIAADQEALRRAEVEANAKTFEEERAVWQQLAEEQEKKLQEAEARWQAELQKIQVQAASAPPAEIEKVVEKAQEASAQLPLTEADTRRIIDRQLRDAGWEADFEVATYAKGSRPQKGKNTAIGEWPTANGPADYMLFAGLMPIAIVEAKRSATNIPGSIEQAKRYSRGYQVSADQTSPGGPWAEYRVPFLFATNGRPYLRQIAERSGIWFLDARRPQNHAAPLDGWMTPEGLLAALKHDIDQASRNLREEPSDYLPLRDYQRAAIAAVEQALAADQDHILLAMATGTGKTITCLSLIYRLIKAGRFHRILFLVDRNALASQTESVFKDVKLEQQQAFTDIYDLKAIGDQKPDKDTRVHIATVQGMMRRILYPADGDEPLPVDTYDCIIVDECHRGYILDKEMGEIDFRFRDERDYISKYRRVLDHFHAVKIGLTATPALHTTEIFGRPVFEYTYRQAVIDGWLVDHEPPIQIVTELAEDGMTWQAGMEMLKLNPQTQTIRRETVADEVSVDVEEFNRGVLTENFNRVVLHELARHIDPELPGKTLIFAVNDEHADRIVRLLKEALDEQYDGVDDNLVKKITGKSDYPLRLIRFYRNEQMPKVAVTVDLLTTGIDIPSISNLVFIRRVNSRILFEQMLGRATRLCDGKERFRIFDCVNVYSALAPHSDMKPVVNKPSVTFEQLVKELHELKEDELAKQVVEQIIAKLQGKKGRIKGRSESDLEGQVGMSLNALLKLLKTSEPKAIAEWFARNTYVPGHLDRAVGDPIELIVSEHVDTVRRVEHGYGSGKKPADYLESFGKYITENVNKIAGLMVVVQRPRELTRAQLREVKLLLDGLGYNEEALRAAWKDTTNQDVAASIIGFIRQKALGSPLIPYEERVVRAIARVLASRSWTDTQRKWLERIGKQLKNEVVLDPESLDKGDAWKQAGGFKGLNKRFDGQLGAILQDLNEAVWHDVA